jgi:hypothetical protein
MPKVLMSGYFKGRKAKPSLCFAGQSILFVEENVKYPGYWCNSSKDSFTEDQRIIKITR